jgi:hypothetical protein
MGLIVLFKFNCPIKPITQKATLYRPSYFFRNGDRSMSKGLPEHLQKYVDLTSVYWIDRHPSEKIIKNHFERIKTEAENALDVGELEAIKEFTEKSFIHFQKLISKEDTSLEGKLEEEYKETKEEIKKRYDKVKTITIEKETTIEGGPGGVKIVRKKVKQLTIQKKANTE